MPIIHVSSLQEFNSRISSKAAIVVDFFAQWCGPCKMIAPKFEQLSNEYPSITFIKIDVDTQGDIAQHSGVRSMPTFHFYKDGARVKELIGADPNRLNEYLQQIK